MLITWWIWISAGVLFLLAEAITPGGFYLIFIGLSALLVGALTPLLLAADAPGKEILHPVAVVTVGGLVSSTLLDTLLTPVLFWLFGRKPTERLLAEEAHTPALPEASEAY